MKERIAQKRQRPVSQNSDYEGNIEALANLEDDDEDDSNQDSDEDMTGMTIDMPDSKYPQLYNKNPNR